MLILILISTTFGQDCFTCCSSLPYRPSMEFKYYQNTGRFVGGSGKYAINTYGYSGNNTDGVNGRNNPSAQCVSNTGPAPANMYVLGNCSDTMHGGTVQRPCSFPMNPQFEKAMCGRFGMWVHGCNSCSTEYPDCDYTAPPCGTCSEGCVVIMRSARQLLRTGDILFVEKYDPEFIIKSRLV